MNPWSNPSDSVPIATLEAQPMARCTEQSLVGGTRAKYPETKYHLGTPLKDMDDMDGER